MKALFGKSAFTNSDFAGDKDTRRSITGFIIYFMGCAISWHLRNQRSVALLSTEAVYYGISDVVTELLFIKSLLEFMGIKVQ